MADGIKGKRVADGTASHLLQPGEYSKMDGYWNCRPPAMGRYPHSLSGRLVTHTVVEHEDRTITVTPSILQKYGDNEEAWHGYLTQGVWTVV